MKLPARLALLVALAVSAGEPALAAAAPAVRPPATGSEIGQFLNERRGRAFWFASDNAAEVLLALLQQASLDDLDASHYSIATLRRLASNALFNVLAARA